VASPRGRRRVSLTPSGLNATASGVDRQRGDVGGGGAAGSMERFARSLTAGPDECAPERADEGVDGAAGVGLGQPAADEVAAAPVDQWAKTSAATSRSSGTASPTSPVTVATGQRLAQPACSMSSAAWAKAASTPVASLSRREAVDVDHGFDDAIRRFLGQPRRSGSHQPRDRRARGLHSHCRVSRRPHQSQARTRTRGPHRRLGPEPRRWQRCAWARESAKLPMTVRRG
jgi:hypothetical protein